MLADASRNTSSGQLTHGIELDSSITSVVEFIEIHFTQFREKVKGEITASEKSLTDKLCKYFNRNAGSYPFYFHHENVENPASGISPQTDIGTLSDNEKLVIGDRSYGEFDSFFSIEAKRLPTPGQNREKEYVIGQDRPSGGIERFKSGIHGKNLKYAAIIGYIQEEDANHWYLKINNWIGELMSSTPDLWKEDDKLIEQASKLDGINKFVSKNFRSEAKGQEDFISLFHFWISLID
ncbi:hypothetical protein [Altibacter sp. HG106]|uniref:hypothetical protein n=1 Tax=Altibacter sp. HG106 TaxID=3023937 RepID=UPI002350BED4|nr:hypothetical protein [Altibacter sp. HG106]MDC7996333.1 hypothetical protein [Altibacter sp. HG106]